MAKFLFGMNADLQINQDYREDSVSFPLNYNPIALRKAKIVFNFGLSECNRVKFLRSS